MNDKRKPSQESHHDKATNHERPQRYTVDYAEPVRPSGERIGPVTINERDPLPTKPPTRKDK